MIVASRTSIKETCADMDHETVVSSLFVSVSKVKRDRDQNVVHTLRETSLNGKLNWPCEEKNWLSKNYMKLRQTWRSNIGKREIRILFFMRSIKSSSPQRLQLQQANQWADQAQRDKVSLYGELEMRNSLFKRKSSKRLSRY